MAQEGRRMMETTKLIWGCIWRGFAFVACCAIAVMIFIKTLNFFFMVVRTHPFITGISIYLIVSVVVTIIFILIASADLGR